MKNADVRKAIEGAGVRYWQVAKALGIGDTTFSRRLRSEMSKEEKEQIFQAISKVEKEE